MQTLPHAVQRGEERIPLQFPVRIVRNGDQTADPTTGEIHNISWHGLCLRCEETCLPGQLVSIYFGITPEENDLCVQGTVKWVSYKNGHTWIGVDLRHSGNDCLDLLKERGLAMGDCPSCNVPTRPSGYDLPYCPAAEYRSEIFWGLFCSIFGKRLYDHLGQMANTVNFTSTALTSAFPVPEMATDTQSDREAARQKRDEIQQLLRQSGDHLLDLARLINVMHQEHIDAALERKHNASKTVLLNEVLLSRLHTFTRKLEYLRINLRNRLATRFEHDIPLATIPWRLHTALDMLILHMHHYLFTGTADTVTFSAATDEQSIWLQTDLNGGPILPQAERTLCFEPRQCLLATPSSTPKTHLFWIDSILCLLHHHAPRATLHNEAGNNSLILRLSSLV